MPVWIHARCGSCGIKKNVRPKTGICAPCGYRIKALNLGHWCEFRAPAVAEDGTAYVVACSGLRVPGGLYCKEHTAEETQLNLIGFE